MSTRTIGLGALALRSTLLALLGLALAGTPAALASPGDYDGDGTPNAQDCAPLDPAVHPGAVDRPDLAFEDSNCDGIDGDQAKAIFVAPGGRDADAGTLTRPKRTLAAAIGAAQTQGKDVYLAGGTYPGSATLASGVGLYGGYEVITGRRDLREVTTITGTPQGALADGATSVVLQLLTLSGSSQGAGGSAYGLRAINGSEVVLQRVVSSAGDGRPGAAGTPGTSGGSGSAGDQGDDFKFDGATANGGSAGGGANAGGAGGNGRSNQSGQDGHDGFTSTGDGAEGAGGTGGQPTGAPGLDGVAGDDGTDGAGGGGGAAGTFSTASAGAQWAGRENASDGSTGRGGGGGGGGGAGTGAPNCGGPGLNVPSGNAGGGGGGGGYGGTGGTAGRDGGGSFAVYAYRSRVVVSDSTLKTGDGGAGGAGAPGGAGGIGGTGGAGQDYPGYENPCFPHFDDPASQIVGDGGAGGAGGAGGTGGTGGGGAGGPSVAVFATGTGATFTFAKPSRFQLGDEGDGGAGSAQGDSGLSGQTIGAQQSSTTADLDGDDVADAADDCPGVAGVRPNGCPARPARLADTDGDGIPDGQDGCPSVAGAPADGGCPPLPAPTRPPADADHDGSPAGQDCDDADPAIHPGAAEIRGNAVDENCDGIVARNLANPAKLARPAFTAARKGDGRTLRAFAASKLPAGSTVVVSCSGRHCPFKSRALTGPRRGGTVDIRRKLTAAQRALHKGEVLTVRVTAPGYRVKLARYPVR